MCGTVGRLRGTPWHNFCHYKRERRRERESWSQLQFETPLSTSSLRRRMRQFIIQTLSNRYSDLSRLKCLLYFLRFCECVQVLYVLPKYIKQHNDKNIYIYLVLLEQCSTGLSRHTFVSNPPQTVWMPHKCAVGEAEALLQEHQIIVPRGRSIMLSALGTVRVLEPLSFPW